MAVTVRSFEPSDAPAVLRVLAESMYADPISDAKFTRQVRLDPNFRREGAGVAELDGRVVGFCLAIARQVPLENAPSDAERGYITLLGVVPDARCADGATILLRHAESFLRAQGRKTVMVSSYAPGYFIPGVDLGPYAGALPFFLSQGYKEVYRPLAMQVSLWDWRAPEWIAGREQELAGQGVTFRTYASDLTLPLLDFTAREFPGDWVRVVREGMHRILQGDSPTRLIVALDREQGGQVVGFSHYDNERFGPIGVATSQRGRGLGQLLMFKTLQAQREAGFRAAWFLWSDDKTAARIYNGAGFKEVRRFALLRKDFA